MENLENRQQTAAELTGETVNTVALDLQLLLSRGLLVSVHVHGTGLFNSALSFEELGIKGSDLEGKAKAARRIIDKSIDDRLNSWGAQCRQAIIKYAVKLESIDALTASASWRLLLYSAYPDFKQRWDELQAMGRRIVADALTEYDNIINENRAYYEERARQNWDALQARYPNGVALSVPGYTFGPYDRAQYIEWVVGQAIAAIPTREAIESSIYATYQTSILFTDADLAAEDARAAEARAARAEADTRLAGAYVAQAQADAIRQAELERARQELRETASPIRELLAQLFEQLAEGTRTLLDGYARSGQFRGRSLDVAKNFPTLMRYLGGEFLQDAEIRALIEQAQGLAASASSDARDGQLVANLSELRGLVEAQLTELKSTRVTHTRAAHIEL